MTQKTSNPTFNDICNALAARRCYDSGQPLAVIAKSAKVPVHTVRQWILTTYGNGSFSCPLLLPSRE